MSASVQTPAAELRIRASADRVRDASHWLAQLGAAFGIPGDQLNRLDLCLNEALANIISHGSPAASTELVHLRLDVRRDGEACEATVTVSDAGPAFDMSSAGAKQRPKSLAEAEPGGLGLLMIRSFSDKLGYDYRDGRNHLSFGVQWLEPH
jgi:serine/threonine-protein kinase RsbW